MKKIIYISLITLLNMPFTAFTQTYKGNLKVKFQVYVNNKTIGDAKIEVIENGTKINDFFTTEKGKVDVELAFNRNYTINVSKNKCVTNIFTFNTTLPKDEIDEVYTFECFVDLFEEMQGVNFSIFERPLVEIKFDEEYGGFDVEEARIEVLNKEIASIKNQIDNQSKYFENENKYKEAIAIADMFFAQKEWSKAKVSYQKASNFKNNEKYINEKISEIDNIISKKDKPTYSLN